MADHESEWFSVRCLFRAGSNKAWGPHDLKRGESAYEERITLWQAESADEAIRLAENDARTYEAQIEVEYLGLAQSYRIPNPVDHGGEVFSLVRRSTLLPTDYIKPVLRHRDGGVPGLNGVGGVPVRRDREAPNG
jgi:hypothetical protein